MDERITERLKLRPEWICVDSAGVEYLIHGIATPASELQFEFTALNAETGETLLYCPDWQGGLRYLGAPEAEALVIYWYTPEDRRAMPIERFLEEFRVGEGE